MQQILQKITAVFLSLAGIIGLSTSQRPVVDAPDPVEIPQPDYAVMAEA